MKLTQDFKTQINNKRGGELAPIISDLGQIVQLIEQGSEPMAIILIYDLLDRLQEAQKPV
jgi:hypothetical protein